jgi:hypothetical protein
MSRKTRKFTGSSVGKVGLHPVALVTWVTTVCFEWGKRP